MQNKFKANKYRGWMWKWEDREGTIDFGANNEPIHLKNDVIDTGLTKPYIFEILLLKYVLPLFVMLSFFHFDWFATGMLGMSSAIALTVMFDYFTKKHSIQMGYLSLLILPFAYYIFRVVFSAENEIYRFTAILNYTFQYLVFIFLMKKIVLDFLNKGYKNVYRTDLYLFQYIQLPFKLGYQLKTKNEKIVRNVLLTVMFFTFILGAINLGGKIARNYNDAKFVEKAKVEAQLKKESGIKLSLDAKAVELGISADKQAHLTDSAVTDYQLIYIFKNQVFVDSETGQKITYPNERTAIVSHIKNNKFYIFTNGREYYIDGVKAE
jgi:hypothetical protein